MAECLANLFSLNNQTTDMFETMTAEDACKSFSFKTIKKNIL